MSNGYASKTCLIALSHVGSGQAYPWGSDFNWVQLHYQCGEVRVRNLDFALLTSFYSDTRQHLSTFLLYFLQFWSLSTFSSVMAENKTAEWINFAVNRASDIPVIGGRIRKVSMTYGPRPSLTQSSPSRLSTSSDLRPPPSYSSVQTSSSLVVSGGLDSKSIIEKIEAKKVARLDRQSLIQGLRMVDLAAIEYQEGNDSIALDIYLHGLDKIVMGLPGIKHSFLYNRQNFCYTTDSLPQPHD
jgi:hypothetical protein